MEFKVDLTPMARRDTLRIVIMRNVSKAHHGSSCSTATSALACVCSCACCRMAMC